MFAQASREEPGSNQMGLGVTWLLLEAQGPRYINTGYVGFYVLVVYMYTHTYIYIYVS